MNPVNVKAPVRLEPGDTHEVLQRPDRNALFLWVTRAESWVTTFVKGRAGRKTYLRVTNIGDAAITLDAHETLGWWTPSDGQPRSRGFVRLGSPRYQQWQNVAYGATRDAEENWIPAELDGPMTDRPSYPTPKAILRPEPRQLGTRRAVTPVLAVVAETPKGSGVEVPPGNHELYADEETVEGEPDVPPAGAGSAAMEGSPESEFAKPKLDDPKHDEPKLDGQEEDDAILIHEGSDI
ncbi:hypothetical protein PF005_g32960, partial [Phytophthora fragariae]